MDDIFYSKLDNFIKKNNFYESAVMQCFLNPAEQYDTETYMRTHHGDISYIFDGGYEFAERRLFVLNPDNDICVKSVYIKGSGFNTLSHKDYMGAVLGLGIERWCLGDIVVDGDNSGAVIFVTDAICEYILSGEKPLEYIGRDKVSVKEFTPSDDFETDRKFIEITGVVASSRLDSVVAVIAKTSREKAKTLISGGNVQHNYTPELNNDTPVKSGDMVSVRGHGRFNIKDISQKTKKDKIRLHALKYI
jgi:Uncharacterized conserved protein, contains S4-like domain